LLLHVHTSSGEETAQAVEACGRRAFILKADLSTTAGAALLGNDALSATGRVDILVNSAALFFPTPLPTLSASSWRSIVQTNLTSPFALALTLGRTMQKNGGGKVIQLADWSGVRPVSGFLPYCVSKNGVLAMTQALAKALSPHVQVNAVSPGPVLPPDHYTQAMLQRLAEQTPLRRIGQTADIARAVCFLAGAAEFVTGANYIVDGGWLAKVADGSTTSL
jgi:NAD(P)-dependent dehydrogenase (short-subunit alcohol dehydrogenase family)